jgi:hypothetical protein
VLNEGASGFVAGVDGVPAEFRKEEKELIFTSLLTGSFCTVSLAGKNRVARVRLLFVTILSRDQNPQLRSQPRQIYEQALRMSSYSPRKSLPKSSHNYIP